MYCVIDSYDLSTKFIKWKYDRQVASVRFYEASHSPVLNTVKYEYDDDDNDYDDNDDDGVLRRINRVASMYLNLSITTIG
jgi:hypothetical protein